MNERHEKLPAESVLAAPRRPVTRYRPWIIAGGAGAVLLVTGFGFMMAFQDRRPPPAQAPPSPAPPAAGPPELDGRLPASYDDLLALGAPGGRAPEAEVGAALTADMPPSGAAAPSTEAAAGEQERLAAQASGPFFGGAQAAGLSPVPAHDDAVQGPRSPMAAAPAVDASAQERFVTGAAGGASVVPHLASPPMTALEIKAGTIISAALVTGLNSDLPGPVIAQVTEPVFDHVSGWRELIPQGARLIGRYDSKVGHGQDRVLVVWTRIVFPDGRSLDIGAMTGADTTGAGGLADQVDAHVPKLARAVGLSTLVSIGAAAAQNSLARSADNLVLQDGAAGLAASASETGRRIVERDVQRAPTLRVRPGWPLRLIVDRDLLFAR